MKWPQFTIRDLLVSTTMIAGGIGLLCAAAMALVSLTLVIRGADISELRFGNTATIELLVGLALLFGGILYPFGKARLGAAIGVLLGVVFFMATWAMLIYRYSP